MTKKATKTSKTATKAAPVTPVAKSKKNVAEKAAAGAAVIGGKQEAKREVKAAKVAPVTAAPVATIAPAEVSKRVTPGATIAEWRVVRSQRKTQPGWFLQGGNYAEVNGRNAFTVGAEVHYADKAEAAAALAARKQRAAAA